MLVPGLGRDVAEVALRIVDAGAVDQDVDPADAASAALATACLSPTSSAIASQLPSALIAFSACFERVVRCGPEITTCAPAARELDAAGEADARAAAGDPGDFTLQGLPSGILRGAEKDLRSVPC